MDTTTQESAEQKETSFATKVGREVATTTATTLTGVATLFAANFVARKFQTFRATRQANKAVHNVTTLNPES